MLLQQYIASGRNLRKNLGQKESIYAQADLLPNLRQTEKENEFREQELDIMKSNAQRDYDLSLKDLKQQKAEAKRSNVLGAGKLALDAYLGYKANSDSPTSIIEGTDAKKGVTKAAGEFTTPSADTGFETGMQTAGIGLGAVGGGLLASKYSKKLAEELPGGEKEWEVAAPVVGSAAGGYVGGVAARAASPYVSNIWKTVGSWFGW